MIGLISVHPETSAAAVTTTGWHSGISLIARCLRDLFRDLLSSYRPELHYMRGPGPKWRERHGWRESEWAITGLGPRAGAGS